MKVKSESLKERRRGESVKVREWRIKARGG